MFNIFANIYYKIQDYCLELCKFRPLPKHVAFIVDGNRRFARAYEIPIPKAHIQGYNNFYELAKTCYNLGIIEVSGYFMAVANFNRGKEQVNNIFNSIINFLENLSSHGHLTEMGICVRFMGEFSLVPENVQKLCDKIMFATKDNDKYFLNIFMPYDSQHEVTAAVNRILDNVEKKLIRPNEIDRKLFEDCLYLSSDVDIMVRSSGVTRLSDFLLWQSMGAYLNFCNPFFPNVGKWNLIWALYKFQNGLDDLQKFKTEHKINKL